MSKVLAAVESYLMCVTKKWTLLCLVEITAGDLSITRLVDFISTRMVDSLPF